MINGSMRLFWPAWFTQPAIAVFTIILSGCGKSFGRASLFDAVKDGDIETVKSEIKEHPDLISATDYFGRSLMDIAIMYGQVKVESVLLDSGADVNGQDAVHQRPLYTAVGGRQLESVKLLLDYKADVNAKARDGSTPLIAACSVGATGDTVPYDIVKLLLAHAADVDAKGFMGRTALDLAAASDRKNIVMLLLTHKASINMKDDSGWTPLHEAAASGAKEVVELLLENGANIDAKDTNGMTPLDVAAIQSNQDYKVLMSQFDAAKICGERDVVELLLSKKARYNIFDATAVGDLKEAEAIVQKKAVMVFSKDSYGKTPLHYAATLEKKDVAEFLLSAKADVNAKDNQGETPLFLAAYAGRRELADLLLSRGADVNAKANMDVTPLHMAATIGHNDPQLVQLLLDHGADVNAKTKTGETPLEEAMRDGAIAKVLVAHGGHF